MSYTGSVPDTRRTPDWRAASACRDEDPELFFPNPGDTCGANLAKEICAACPVRRTCLTNALAEEGGKAKDNRFGVRGGKTHGERYGLYVTARKRRQQVAA